MAYEELLGRYLAALRRLAWSYARDAAEAEDLFQEIAMSLWTALPRFRGESSERTWVYRVAHNTAIGYMASRRRRLAREQGSPTLEPVSTALTPEGEAIDKQRQARLWECVRGLNLPDRQAIVLHLEGLSAIEIEEVTGYSAGSIATRLTRIRQKLMRRVHELERR